MVTVDLGLRGTDTQTDRCLFYFLLQNAQLYWHSFSVPQNQAKYKHL